MTLVVGIGFALFRPDWFHNQNGLDPYFYTGLSLNLSDTIVYGTDAHYFLSRWTLYLPELLIQRLLGASVGFVTVRLILLVLGGLGLAMLRPAASRRLDLVPVAAVVLFSPLLARAVFVDYSDTIVVSCGLFMIALAAKGPVRVHTAAVIGLLGACAVVANAFAVFMVAITVGAYLSRSLTRPRRLATHLAALIAAAVIVIVGGLLFFRWRYGVPDVYAPTVDFIRNNAGFHDPLKSPRLLWLQYRLWIYLPPLVIAAAGSLRAARLVRLGTGEAVVLAICAVQYAFQVVYQFAFDGSTLEISYYFSYMVPAYSAALAVLLYAVFHRCSARSALAVTAAVTLVLATWRYLPAVHLGSWAIFTVAVAAFAAIGAVLARRMPVLLPGAVVSVALAAQLTPPKHEPALPGELRVQAGYETLYRGGTSDGVHRFRSVSAFVRRMNDLDPDVRKGSGWIVADGIGAQMAAAYSVQVGLPSRWLNPLLGSVDEDRAIILSRFAVDRFTEEGLTHLVVVSSPEQLPGIIDRLAGFGLVLAPPVLDYVDDEAAPPTQVYVARVAAVERQQ